MNKHGYTLSEAVSSERERRVDAPHLENCTKKDRGIVMRLFDTNKDGKINYSEFVERLMPRSPEFSSMLNNRGHR